MRRVIVESPYAGATERNVCYARAAIADCLKRGEAPFASHLLYTQPDVLDDLDPAQRKMGIEAGYEWWDSADAVIFYVDLGWSPGMRKATERLVNSEKNVELRNLPVEVMLSLSSS
jgi:hypothetical protein